jgi:hypothetical protein
MHDHTELDSQERRDASPSTFSRTALCWIKWLCAAIAALSAATAIAQGGPPLVTDDPGTPGDGKWEINLAAIYAHVPGRRELAAPDADINYGLGDHIQLKADIPWVFVKDDSMGGKKNGLGAGNFGVKWRFIDQENAGFSMSTYPQYTRNLQRSSVRRGITSDEKSFFLPIEASTEVGGFGLDAEVGRNFVTHGTNEWEAGFIVAHACSERIECLAEVHETFAPGVHQTLFNLGLRAKINDSLSFIGAVGRDFGGRAEDRRSALVYVGFQLLR